MKTVDRWLQTIRHKSAMNDTRDNIEWTMRLYQRPVMTSAFGLSGMVLIHILKEMGHDVPVVFVDTGMMFYETLAMRPQVAAMGFEVVTFIPQSYPRPYDVIKDGRSKNRDEKRIAACCEARKIQPMRRALALLRPDAILTARGRFQAVTRQALPFFEGTQSPPRVNPLATWTQEQIEQYVKNHGVPHNPLHDDGYFSVGCWPCTRPLKEDEDVRAGRWDGLGKVECGIWR